MAASYPGSVKSFTTKTSADYYAASHINDLQDEVVALETAIGATPLAGQTDVKSRITAAENGWILANETWTYATSTTLTIAADVTTKYYRGDFIRFKQGGSYKYFYIILTAYGAPNTTLTVVPSNATDVVANAAITDNYFCRLAPLGYAADAPSVIQTFLHMSGWRIFPYPCVYASATSFTVTGVDVTGFMKAGTPLMLYQTTGKYFYVTSSTFSTNTTVNVTGGSDYTVANAAIEAIYFAPVGTCPGSFPNWFNYTPSITGFSANPTGTYRFSMSGTTVTVSMKESANGTSNLTTKTYTIPVTAKTITNHAWCAHNPAYYNNGTAGYAGFSIIGSAGTSMALYLASMAVWTASGNCRCFDNAGGSGGLTMSYECA